MAKNQQRGREGSMSASPAAPSSDPSQTAEDTTEAEDASSESSQTAEETVVEKPAPWRRIALCIKSCTVAFSLGTNKILGGEWIREQEHVAVIARDPNFRLYDVNSPAEIDALIADHATKIVSLAAMAGQLGYVLVQDGSTVPARR